MEKLQEILMKLYWKMWVSADFVNDFQEEFPAIYQKMKVGNHYQISLIDANNAFNYMQYWERKNLFKNFYK